MRFGSLRDHEEFYTPNGKRYLKTTKPGAACLFDDNAVLVYFADDSLVLTPAEHAGLDAIPVGGNTTPAPAQPTTTTVVDDAEFDAAPPAASNTTPAPPAGNEPPKSSKKK